MIGFELWTTYDVGSNHSSNYVLFSTQESFRVKFRSDLENLFEVFSTKMFSHKSMKRECDNLINVKAKSGHFSGSAKYGELH